NWLVNKSADGRIELSGALDRRMRMRVRADGYLPNYVDLLYANVPQDEIMKAITIQLEPGYELSGTVIDDATGAPIGGAYVRAMAELDATYSEGYLLANPD